MKRRAFITLLGGVAAAWPLAARAQQPGKLPTIGFLGASTMAQQSHMVAALVGRLHELGWIEGRTIAIDYRWAEGRDERFGEIAAEFVRLKVDAILTHSTQAALAAKQATSVIPIVATVVGDPVGSGLVASLARPGGNVTGLSVLSADMAAKRLEILREAVPSFHRLAILLHDHNPVNVEETRQVQAAAAELGIETFPIAIRRAEDIAPAFDRLKDRADALYVAVMQGAEIVEELIVEGLIDKDAYRVEHDKLKEFVFDGKRDQLWNVIPGSIYTSEEKAAYIDRLKRNLSSKDWMIRYLSGRTLEIMTKSAGAASKGTTLDGEHVLGFAGTYPA